MHKLVIVITTLQVMLTAAAAQSGSESPASKANSLSMEQQEKIGEIITNAQTKPLTNVRFPISIDSVVPEEVPLQPLPSSAEELAPRFRGFSYVAVDEVIAIVEGGTRKIAIVIPRWRRQ
jgi:Protein of unknown function (DUF1236)